MRVLLVSAFLAMLAQAALAAPPPDHPSVDDASRLLGIPGGATMSESGRVREAIDSNNYTYLRVEGCRGSQWLAAPRRAFVPGETIAWGPGAVMTDFHSKVLGRTFARILFVSGTASAADLQCGS